MQTSDHIVTAAGETANAAAFNSHHLIKALIELNIARKNVLFLSGEP
jgi:hypothetical protein